MPKLLEEMEPGRVITRAFFPDCEVRSINVEKRTAEFVAATENGVDTWRGKEYLKMSGAKLTRYRKNPVVLDTHDRFTAGSVIGRADIKVEGKQLLATITFAPTARAEEVWTLVRGGFLRALSAGFMPNAKTMKDLMDGEMDGEGEDKIMGPGRVIRSWELLEISVVPVPADPDSIRRNFEDQAQSVAAVLAALGISPRPQGAERTLTMSDKEKPTGAAPQEGTESKRDAAVAEMTPEARALKAGAESIRAISPRGMDWLADALIVRGATLEDARKEFTAELEKTSKPVGNPEPVKSGVTKPETKRAVGDLTAQDLLGY